MQKNKGITLVGLVVTIIVLLILAGVSIATLTGDNGIITKANEAAKKSNLESLKEDIKLQISEEIASNNGMNPTNEALKSILEKYGTVEYEADGVTVKGVVTTAGDEILLSDLGKISISSLGEPDTINVTYDIKGISGSVYNILVKITSSSGLEKIVYKNNIGEDITLNCDNNLEVDIDYQVNIDTDYFFTVKESGQTAKIKKINVAKITTIIADGGWNGTVNSPKLATGMTGIYWDESGNEVTVISDNQGNWYDYANKKWANAKTADGSYFVWMPRYEYKIPTLHSNTAQIIDVKFIQDTNTTADSGYTMHPGFTFGTTELQGIWVAKFEASGATTAVDSKPNVTSLRNITISTMFDACRNMETNSRYGWGTSGTEIDTHLMKNIEWGVCSYLSSSQFGKTGEVWINPNSNYITGQAGTIVDSGATTSTYAYNNITYGVNSSTTGNIYGIYDMSGCAWEYTAAYVNSGAAVLSTDGLSLVNAEAKYKDVYASTDYLTATQNKKGDAIYETSSNGSGNYSWYIDFSYYTGALFIRGASYNYGNGAGMFAYDYNGGGYSFYSFRPVISVSQ